MILCTIARAIHLRKQDEIELLLGAFSTCLLQPNLSSQWKPCQYHIIVANDVALYNRYFKNCHHVVISSGIFTKSMPQFLSMHSITNNNSSRTRSEASEFIASCGPGEPSVVHICTVLIDIADGPWTRSGISSNAKPTSTEESTP